MQHDEQKKKRKAQKAKGDQPRRDETENQTFPPFGADFDRPGQPDPRQQRPERKDRGDERARP